MHVSPHSICDLCYHAHSRASVVYFSFARQEWDIVVRGCIPPPEHMHHGRILRDVGEMMQSDTVAKAKLHTADQEVIAVVLYTSPW